jgi:hypothetical protein
MAEWRPWFAAALLRVAVASWAGVWLARRPIAGRWPIRAKEFVTLVAAWAIRVAIADAAAELVHIFAEWKIREAATKLVVVERQAMKCRHICNRGWNRAGESVAIQPQQIEFFHFAKFRGNRTFELVDALWGRGGQIWK